MDLVYMIKDYIENEIDYIKESMTCDTQNIEDYATDLTALRKLNDADIKKIAEQVENDYELEELINQLIHDYLYGYLEETD